MGMTDSQGGSYTSLSILFRLIDHGPALALLQTDSHQQPTASKRNARKAFSGFRFHNLLNLLTLTSHSLDHELSQASGSLIEVIAHDLKT